MGYGKRVDIIITENGELEVDSNCQPFLYTSSHSGDYIQGHIVLLSLRYIMIILQKLCQRCIVYKKNRRYFTASSIQNNNKLKIYEHC